MPNLPQPSFDHEATLEELAGVGKNHRFDEIIDDEEFEDIRVICKRGDEEAGAWNELNAGEKY
jgi:hypothetical protein